MCLPFLGIAEGYTASPQGQPVATSKVPTEADTATTLVTKRLPRLA